MPTAFSIEISPPRTVGRNLKKLLVSLTIGLSFSPMNSPTPTVDELDRHSKKKRLVPLLLPLPGLVEITRPLLGIVPVDGVKTAIPTPAKKKISHK